MTKHTAIITDSTCDLPQDKIEEHQVLIVPLTIIWGQETFRDGVDIQPKEFYQRLESEDRFPTTSQPTPEDMEAACRQAADQGAEEILIITISSAMSGTFDSARQAADRFPLPVHLHDSRSNSMGLGWQVLAAARAREEGADPQGMIQAADRVRERMQYLISLDTLEYLHRGGRIGGASRFIGTILNLKPQITVNHQTGEVEAGRRSRTREKALQDLYRDFFNSVDPAFGEDLRVAVLHNAAPDQAEQLARRVREEYQPQELIIQIVSPILGVHTGPRAIALCGYSL
ncbi:MAG: DegV family protein [Anaerolineales bacterium]|nr:DegV family protein [Anaerolineales bacterium]